MRVWDVHPGYLSDRSLLGQHVEIHALFNVITGNKKGYSRHPETLRWRAHVDKLAVRHELTVREMLLRGFNHSSPCESTSPDKDPGETVLAFIDRPEGQFAILREKFSQQGREGRIPLPKSGSDFWAHHKYSVMARGYNHYKAMQEFIKGSKNLPISEEGELIFTVLEYMEKPMEDKALVNVLEHLWGYMKKDVSLEEKRNFPNNPESALKHIYTLAKKYNKRYLLHSTVFADL